MCILYSSPSFTTNGRKWTFSYAFPVKSESSTICIYQTNIQTEHNKQWLFSGNPRDTVTTIYLPWYWLLSRNTSNPDGPIWAVYWEAVYFHENGPVLGVSACLYRFLAVDRSCGHVPQRLCMFFDVVVLTLSDFRKKWSFWPHRNDWFDVCSSTRWFGAA